MTDSSNAKEAGWLDALRCRDFRLLWSGQAVSAIGNQMFPIALAVLVVQRGMGAGGLGLVLATQGIALAVGTLLSSSVGDRWARTPVMIASDVSRLAGVLVLAAASRTMPLGVLLVVVAVTGCGEGLFQPAWSAPRPRECSRRLARPAWFSGSTPRPSPPASARSSPSRSQRPRRRALTARPAPQSPLLAPCAKPPPTSPRASALSVSA